MLIAKVSLMQYLKTAKFMEVLNRQTLNNKLGSQELIIQEKEIALTLLAETNSIEFSMHTTLLVRRVNIREVTPPKVTINNTRAIKMVQQKLRKIKFVVTFRSCWTFF